MQVDLHTASGPVHTTSVVNCVVYGNDGIPLVLISQRPGTGIWMIDATDKSFIESLLALGIDPKVKRAELRDVR